ncbi:hypothetical protein DVA81_18875, partial [Acinetobacter baumannii]
HDVQLVKGFKHNLLSISQFCDNGFKVLFESNQCTIQDSETSKVMFTGQRHGSLYALNLDELFDQKINCFTALENDAWLWHRRLAHIN